MPVVEHLSRYGAVMFVFVAGMLVGVAVTATAGVVLLGDSPGGAPARRAVGRVLGAVLPYGLWLRWGPRRAGTVAVWLDGVRVQAVLENGLLYVFAGGAGWRAALPAALGRRSGTQSRPVTLGFSAQDTTPRAATVRQLGAGVTTVQWQR